MYKGYNIEVKNSDSQQFLMVNDKELEAKMEEVEEIRESLEQNIFQDIDSYVNNNGFIEVEGIIEKWFPEFESDIFISHSHNDEKVALRIAIWLEKNFGLKSFVDSTVWGSADRLLKLIDDKYCYNNDSKTYDYQKRNISTSYIHMILEASLTNMIDKTECIFFINTPNSISVGSDLKSSTRASKTNSPWIYNELQTSKFIRKKYPRAISRNEYFNKSIMNEEIRADLNSFLFPAKLEHLKTLQLEELKKIPMGDINGTDVLDYLYFKL